MQFYHLKEVAIIIIIIVAIMQFCHFKEVAGSKRDR
jgi:hypothetical protein